MMDSLRSATRNTAFDRWLATTMSGPLGGSGSGSTAGRPAADDSPCAGGSTPAAVSAPQVAAGKATAATESSPVEAVTAAEGSAVAASAADGDAPDGAAAATSPPAAQGTVSGGAAATVTEAGADVPLAQVAEYLAAGTPAAAIPGADAPPSQSLSGTFRPGWEVHLITRIHTATADLLKFSTFDLTW